MSTGEDELYALAEEPEPPPPPKRRVPATPAAPGPAGPQAAAAAKPAVTPPPLTSYRALPVGGKSAVERALEAREDEAKPSRFRDLVLPLILLVVGFFGQLVGWWEMAKKPGDAFILIGVALALQALVFLPLALISVAMIAKWFELGLGSLPVVLFKLLALMAGTGGLGDVLFLLVITMQDFEPSTAVAGYGFYLILTGVPLLILLELNIYEMALTVLLFFLPRVAAVFTVAVMLEDYFA